MYKNINNLWTAMAAALVAITGMANANMGNGGCCPPPCCNSNWSAEVDILYWTACERGLTYGSESRNETFGNAGSTSSIHTKLKHPHQRWDVGFRVGVGYDSPCNCWDAMLLYTQYNTDAHAKHDEAVNPNQWFTPAFNAIPGNGDVGGALLGGNSAPDTNSFPVNFANAHWKLRLNLLDLEIGRDFCVNSCFSLRPFIGVRGASINEKYKIRYETERVTGGAVVAFPIDRVHLKNDFEGAGLRGGLDTEFDLGCGMSIYGGVAASLLYGETEIKTREILLSTSGTSSNIFEMTQKDKECGCRAITDAEIGLRWKKTCCNRVVAFQIGWEHHFFFNQNQFEKFTNYRASDNAATDRYPQNDRGDLSVQGIVLSAKVNF